MSSHRSVEIVEKGLFFISLIYNNLLSFTSRFISHVLSSFHFFLFRNEHRGKNTHTPERHDQGGIFGRKVDVVCAVLNRHEATEVQPIKTQTAGISASAALFNLSSTSTT
jgi:hypothetical protein